MSTVNPPAAAAGRQTAFGQRLRNLDRSYWVWILAIVVLLVLVVNPLARLLIVSFQDSEGAFTLANYAAAYGRSRHIDALLNSLVRGRVRGHPVRDLRGARWPGRCRAPTCPSRA